MEYARPPIFAFLIARQNGIKQIFPLSLANGVTGLRVMSTKLEDLKESAQWRVDMAQGNLLGPRIRTASAIL